MSHRDRFPNNNIIIDSRGAGPALMGFPEDEETRKIPSYAPVLAMFGPTARILHERESSLRWSAYWQQHIRLKCKRSVETLKRASKNMQEIVINLFAPVRDCRSCTLGWSDAGHNGILLAMPLPKKCSTTLSSLDKSSEVPVED